MLQFVCFVSTIIQKHAYQFLLYLTDLFGDDYDDYVVCDFLNLVGQLVWIMQDHFQLIRLAMGFPSTVDSYLSVDLERGAVTGPFASNPFSRLIVILPLNSVPKPSSSERWMMLDVSWSTERSFNDAISNRIYLLQPYSLVYPMIDTILEYVATVS